jgi:hypothetical protein
MATAFSTLAAMQAQLEDGRSYLSRLAESLRIIRRTHDEVVRQREVNTAIRCLIGLVEAYQLTQDDVARLQRVIREYDIPVSIE